MLVIHINAVCKKFRRHVSLYAYIRVVVAFVVVQCV